MTNWKRVPCSDFVSLYVITTLNSVLLSLAFGPVPWWCWMTMVIQDLRETQRRFPSGLPFKGTPEQNWRTLYFWIKSDDRLKRQTWWKRSCKPKTVIVCSSLCSGSMWKCIRSSREAHFGLWRWLLSTIITHSAGGRGFHAINPMCPLTLWEPVTDFLSHLHAHVSQSTIGAARRTGKGPGIWTQLVSASYYKM